MTNANAKAARNRTRLMTFALMVVCSMFLFGFEEGGCDLLPIEEGSSSSTPTAASSAMNKRGSCRLIDSKVSMNFCYPDVTHKECQEKRSVSSTARVSWDTRSCKSIGCSKKCNSMTYSCNYKCFL